MSGAEAKASPKRAPESAEVDAKPSDLPLGRLKDRENCLEDRTGKR